MVSANHNGHINNDISDDKVSIIVPVYMINPALLKQSLSSVIAQNYDNLECLVIDDGSPDQCGEICDEYAQKDSRIRVFHTRNAGVSHARNVGLENMSGDYVIFLDADDFLISKDNIEKLVSFAKNLDSDVLFFRHITVNENQEHFVVPECSEEIKEVDLKNTVYEIVSGQDVRDIFLYGAPWGKMIRAKYIQQHMVRFPLGIKKSQDRIFMTRLMSFSPRGFSVDYCAYAYVRNTDSICRKSNPNIINILTETADELKKTIEESYEGDMKIYLEEAFCWFKFKCISNYNNLYFFASDHTLVREDVAKYRSICKEYRPYIRKCKIHHSFSTKERIQLFLLKYHFYWLAYWEERIYSVYRKRFLK